MAYLLRDKRDHKRFYESYGGRAPHCCALSRASRMPRDLCRRVLAQLEQMGFDYFEPVEEYDPHKVVTL